MSVAPAERIFDSPERPEPGELGHLALVTEGGVQFVEPEPVKNLHLGPIDLINCQLTPEERIKVELLGGNLSASDMLH